MLASWTEKLAQGIKGQEDKNGLQAVKSPEDMKNQDDGWIDRFRSMLDEFTRELYSYYPLLRLPGAAVYIGRFDAELAGEMHVPASPEALLARYRKAEAILRAAAETGVISGSAAEAGVVPGTAEGMGATADSTAETVVISGSAAETEIARTPAETEFVSGTPAAEAGVVTSAAKEREIRPVLWQKQVMPDRCTGRYWPCWRRASGT